MQLQRTRLNVVSHKPLLWQQAFDPVYHTWILEQGVHLFCSHCTRRVVVVRRRENMPFIQKMPHLCNLESVATTQRVSLHFCPHRWECRVDTSWRGAPSSLREAVGMEGSHLEMGRANPRAKLDLREICLQYTDHISELFPSLCLDGFWMS